MLFWVKKEEMTQGREATRESKSKPQAQVLEYATAFRKTFRNLLAFKDYENYGYDDFKYATFMLIFKQRSTESNYCTAVKFSNNILVCVFSFRPASVWGAR